MSAPNLPREYKPKWRGIEQARAELAQQAKAASGNEGQAMFDVRALVLDFALNAINLANGGKRLTKSAKPLKTRPVVAGSSKATKRVKKTARRNTRAKKAGEVRKKGPSK
jgi:hypothetical protein